MTRLVPHGVVILLMTRWHTDDICGRILENYDILSLQEIAKNKTREKVWAHLSISAIALPGDILGRQPGELLWQQRFDIDELLNIKKNINVNWFEAMYQQNPLTYEDTIFKRKDFRYFTGKNDYYILGNDIECENVIYRDDCIIRISVDLAVKFGLYRSNCFCHYASILNFNFGSHKTENNRYGTNPYV
jgi:hypothetical protein